MNFKNLFLTHGGICITLAIPALLSCTNDPEPPPVRKLFGISPVTAKIGDTVYIDGTGLDCPTCTFTFNKVPPDNIVNVNDTRYAAVVPTVSNEAVSIVFFDNRVAVDSIAINLTGFIPLRTPFRDDPTEIQAIDADTFFVKGPFGIYLTEDGGYKWTRLSLSVGLSRMCFLTKQTGWVVNRVPEHLANGYTRLYNIIFFTSNGGQTFQPLDTIELLYDDYVTGINFTSLTDGYILSKFGRIYATNDNDEFKKVYEYPLSIYDEAEFRSLTAHGNTVMATGFEESFDYNRRILVIGKNKLFEHGLVNVSLGTVQLISDNEAYMIKGSRLHFSNDTGASWTKQSDHFIQDFYFTDKMTGISMSFDADLLKQMFHLTRDHGATWQPISRAPKIYMINSGAFYGNHGLIAGRDFSAPVAYVLWKYIKN